MSEFDQRIVKYDKELQPASTEVIEKMLATVAVVMNLELPQKEALRAYTSLLQEYPDDLVQYAGIQVMKTHKWPRFPFPADFIKHIDSEFKERHYWRRWHIDQVTKLRGPLPHPPVGGRAGRGPRTIGSILPKIKEPKE